MAVEPAVKDAAYDSVLMLHWLMTPEEQNAPGTADMCQRFVAAFAAGVHRLNLTPLEPT